MRQLHLGAMTRPTASSGEATEVPRRSTAAGQISSTGARPKDQVLLARDAEATRLRTAAERLTDLLHPDYRPAEREAQVARTLEVLHRRNVPRRMRRSPRPAPAPVRAPSPLDAAVRAAEKAGLRVSTRSPRSAATAAAFQASKYSARSTAKRAVPKPPAK